MLLSRRLHPQAPSHQLGRLIDFHGLPRAGVAHRALADAEMAASLLALQQRDLRQRWGVAQPDHALLQLLQRCAKPAVGRLLARLAQPPATDGVEGVSVAAGQTPPDAVASCSAGLPDARRSPQRARTTPA